jgi:hypothetical protein
MDVLRWYNTLAGPGRRSAGYACTIINSFKAVLSYGAMLGGDYDACLRLRQQVAAVRFKGGSRRKSHLTYAHVTAFRKVALRENRLSMALALTIQFEGSFRQGDVIGITEADGRWHDGLTWGHLGADGVIRKTTNKTAAAAALPVAEYPDLAALIAKVPKDRRIGPMIISEATGRPYEGRRYRETFRALAQLAGIPDHVQNRDARGGAITEAYEAGSTKEDNKAMATHTSDSINQGYIQSNVEPVRRVAKLRVQRRQG